MLHNIHFLKNLGRNGILKIIEFKPYLKIEFVEMLIHKRNQTFLHNLINQGNIIHFLYVILIIICDGCDLGLNNNPIKKKKQLVFCTVIRNQKI